MMKLIDFPYLSEDILTVQTTSSPKELVKYREIRLFLEGKDWFVSQDNTLVRVELDNDSGLIETLGRLQETLWLLLDKQNNYLSFQFVRFIEPVNLNLKIGITEKVAEYLQDKKQIDEADIDAACRWFEQCFLLEKDNDNYRLVIAYFKNSSDKQFLAIGNQWQAHISRDENKVIVQKLTRIKSEQPDLSLITGKIEFYNAEIKERLLDPTQQALLDTSLRDNGSYLELWKHYNDLQWAKATQYASELGIIKFVNRQAIDGDKLAWEFFVKSSEKLSAFRGKWQNLGLTNTQVEVTTEQPSWLLDREIIETSELPNKNEIFRGKVSFGDNSIIITPDEMRRSRTPAKTGYIAYSLAGEEIVRRRREQAKKSIDNGIRLPQLIHLLQGLDVPPVKYKKLKALTPYAKETFNGGTPTDRQKDALDVALNTSDIALIIGPPGTGKTQVIAALQRRLVEENPDRDVQHQVLISSYEHDAVDNALNRSDVYGLPAIRVGGRSGNKNSTKPITFWCDKRREHIALELEKSKKEEPHVAILEQLHSIFIELKIASLSLSVRMRKFEQVNSLLSKLECLNIRLSSRVKDDWEDFYLNTSQERQQQTLDSPIDNRLLQKTRALRITPASFLDDGMERAYDLYSMLQRKGLLPPKKEGELLKKLCNQEQINIEETHQLGVIRDDLLDCFIPDYRPPEIKNRLSKQEIQLINRIEKDLRDTLVNSRKGIASVLGRYYDALAFSPKQAEQAVENYSAIVGATCQQSASKPMSVLQLLSDLDAQTEIEFESVIVDEAARANPLDLFVPMAMAKRRIVLVGDDRQLPHLLEPELEEELAEQHSLTEIQREAYKQSLFERLRKQLLEIEKKSGVRRVVMLDTQFRMHPMLGDFISKNFYENEGLDVLKSGRPAEDFTHSINGYSGKVCAWLNVALSEGAESRPQFSPMRQIEAQKIAQETKKILESTDNTVSVGVITFYSAQVDAIRREMEKLGLLEQEEIVPEYLYTDDGEERLRVGTVDAFQGKEFDVVLLSIVRANRVKIPDSDIEQEQLEKLLNKKYGHLRLSNRMNVAMSRQRKLLIAVGAMEMAGTPEASSAVPALSNFLNLCGGEYGRIF